jgi:hypothetical protein
MLVITLIYLQAVLHRLGIYRDKKQPGAKFKSIIIIAGN